MKPGFAFDEEPSELGRSLKLPPWEEPYRSEIEAGLPKITK
jgi:glyoxalase family protein